MAYEFQFLILDYPRSQIEYNQLDMTFQAKNTYQTTRLPEDLTFAVLSLCYDLGRILSSDAKSLL